MTPPAHSRIILLGADDADAQRAIEAVLRRQGHPVEAVRDGEEVLAYLRGGRSEVSAVLLDMAMPRKNGMETLREIRSLDRELPVIMLAAAPAPPLVVEAMREGATDFLGKPASQDELSIAVKKALDGRQNGACERLANSAIRDNGAVFYGSTPAMRQIQAIVAQVGQSDAPLLILGETGVGKEVLARQLHACSPRAGKPLLKLNCAALPSELVESELFGYERGAFTGAFQNKPGMFDMADGGTILLDEIGDMDYKLQAKLLRVLQDHEFQRLGGRELIRVDVRVIAATHNDLEKAIENGQFRQDLYYRLNIITLSLPPLRECRQDIVPLSEFLLAKHTRLGTTAPVLSTRLKQALMAHDWPGNIRELENVMRRLIVLGEPETILSGLQSRNSHPALGLRVAAISPEEVEAPRVGAPILEQVTREKERAETEAILAALHSTRWNRKQAALLLKIEYKALLYKMKKLGIEDKVLSFPAGSVAHRANGK